MEQVTIVSSTDAPTKFYQVFYDLWAIEEKNNGDYLLWTKTMDDRFPEFSEWLHGNVASFVDGTTRKTVNPDPAMPILIHFGW